ncbi:MAG: glycosyltransferase [Candidatus Kapaibacterium sp.]
MLETALYIVCGIYLVEYLVFALGIRRALAGTPKLPGELPQISIIVAARNEEANIEACLEALLRQDYPEDRCQVIAVNDESDDDTLTVMNRVADRWGERLRVITTTAESSGIIGKAKAIAQGVDSASGEIILLTDADCIPPTTWASTTVGRFSDSVDVVAGFTLVRSTKLFHRLQQLDWLHLQAIAAASMAFNSPVGVVGNNLAFRRSTYEAIGGYRNVRFSMTEDFALFLAMYRRGVGVAYACDDASCVETQPCADLQTVLRQKHRWGRGGMESTPHGYSILVIAFLMLCALCIAPFTSPLIWGVVWGTKFIADLILLLPVLRELKAVNSLTSFVLFQFYFLAQALVVPLMIVNPNVHWKGRVFTPRSVK